MLSASGSIDVQKVRSHDGLTACELAAPPVPARLRAHVRSWLGYSEAGAPARRRELPGPSVVVILDLGSPLRVTESGDATRWLRHAGGFVAGLDDGPSLTEHDGRHAGIQLSLTPSGARALFGVRLGTIARRVIALSDVLPRSRSLSERLASAPSWAERFAIVEAELFGRTPDAARASAAASWATGQIERSGGRVEIGALASELGYSRKHLAAIFDEHVGLTPKLYASLVRFDRVVDRLKTAPGQRWTDLAFAHGYADQAHLAREVRRFAGVTPTSVKASLAVEHPLFASPAPA
ncbi:MAG: AraC family transcriptional regulator [Labilithrix sp.]|nr:AraC family transcriptional regulator [Labilithrix sp.]